MSASSIATRIVLILLLTGFTQSYAGNGLCRKIKSGKIRKVDKAMKRMIKKKVKATSDLGYPVYAASIDSLIENLKNMDCIQNAAWDRCAIKIAIYPGFASIGMKFEMNGELRERCYNFRLGKMRAIKMGKFLFIPLRSKDVVDYTGAADCPSFVEEQILLCQPGNQ